MQGEYSGAQSWSQGVGRGGVTLSSPGWAGDYGEQKRGEDSTRCSTVVRWNCCGEVGGDMGESWNERE